ncbi:MAG: hypothetical protein GX620_04320 [Chloroflexi bacterium]|nr:hypothetical protein [Chloroflexota bacterium]
MVEQYGSLMIVLSLLVLGGFGTVVGYQRKLDGLLVGGVWLLLSGLCLLRGFTDPGFNWPRFITALIVVVVVALAVGVARKHRLTVMMGAAWAWFWFAAIRGYARGGWIGVLLITLPACVLASVALYLVSQYTLPLNDERQRSYALRSLITFVTGTNGPHVLLRRNLKGVVDIERPKGLPQTKPSKVLSGPGVVLSSCDQVAVVSDGVQFKGVRVPGLSFIGAHDNVTQTIDLRTQMRTFTVPARTKDGIEVEVTAFASFRLDSGGALPRLGQAFPLRAKAAFQAIHHAQLIEHVSDENAIERTKVRPWDDLPKALGTRVVRDIVADFRFDDLCAPYYAAYDPIHRASTEFRRRLRARLAACGIALETADIGAILPAEKNRREILEQRIRSWQIHWVRHIMLLQAEGHRSRLRQIGQARAQAQMNLIRTLGDRLAKVYASETPASVETISSLVLDIVKQMATQPEVQRLLPAQTMASITALEEQIAK